MNTRMSARTFLVAAALLGLAYAQPVAGQLAARPADDWIKLLDNPTRIAGLRVDEIVASVRVKAGDVVADFGAGTGAFSFPLAKAVGPTGRVYSVEIEQGLLDHIEGRAKAEGVANVRTVLGKFDDPSLPASDVDLGFFHDVLHHVQNRAGYLKNVARYIKPGGRVAVIEPLNTHRDQPELQVSPEQVGQWMTDAGFAAAEKVDLLAGSWFVIYSRR